MARILDLDSYCDAVMDEMDRLGANAATDRPETVQLIGHAFMKGRDPVAVAEAIARRLKSE